MADVSLRSIFSVADETVAQLDTLHSQSVQRSVTTRRLLDAVVARLDVVGPPPDIEPDVPRGRRDERAGGSGTGRPDPQPFVALPQRTTHGGTFGPSVRDKLVNEALSRRGW